jgi:hypothetical protein
LEQPDNATIRVRGVIDARSAGSEEVFVLLELDGDRLWIGSGGVRDAARLFHGPTFVGEIIIKSFTWEDTKAVMRTQLGSTMRLEEFKEEP